MRYTLSLLCLAVSKLLWYVIASNLKFCLSTSARTS